MLLTSAYLLAVAALGGLLLFALHGRVGTTWRLWIPGAVHGAFGLAGALVMLPGMLESRQDTVAGTGSFVRIAAILVAVAAGLGVLLFTVRWRRGTLPSTIIGVHATAAVAGLVMLAAYLTTTR